MPKRAVKSKKKPRKYKNTTKKKSVPRTARKVRKQLKRTRKASLSRCAQLYAMSLIDPTGEEGRYACVPSAFPIPSQKARGWVKGSFVLNTAGVGLLLFKPGILVSDSPGLPIQFSGATGTATTTTAFSDANAGVWFGAAGGFAGVISPNLNMANLPFTNSDITSGSTSLDGRYVSGCIRCRYTGTEDGRNGTVTTFEEPNHQSIMGMTITSVKSHNSAHSMRPKIDGSWHQLNWSGPVTQSECEFFSQATIYGPLGATPGETGRAVGCICIEGKAGDTYEFECWANIEYSGAKATAKTPSEADPQGLGKVIQTSHAMQNNGNGEGFVRQVYNYGSSMAKYFAKRTVQNIGNYYADQLAYKGIGLIKSYTAARMGASLFF